MARAIERARDGCSTQVSPVPLAIVIVIVIVIVTMLAAVPGATQETTLAEPYVTPRTSDGQPDIQGVWQVLNTAAWNLEAHNDRLGTPAGHGVVEGGPIPYQAWALARRQQNDANRETLDPEAHCLLPGVPRITYMPYPFQIIQQSDKVTIVYEYRSTVRFLYLTGNPHPPGPIEWFMGDSRAHWEGDTLVVDVVHFTDQTWLDRAGNFHSKQLRVIERYTPTGPDHLLYEVTIDDPAVFTRPWTMSMPLYRRQEQDIEILEYECSAHLIEEAWRDPDGSRLLGTD